MIWTDKGSIEGKIEQDCSYQADDLLHLLPALKSLWGSVRFEKMIKIFEK